MINTETNCECCGYTFRGEDELYCSWSCVTWAKNHTCSLCPSEKIHEDGVQFERDGREPEFACLDCVRKWRADEPENLPNEFRDVG